MDPEAGNPPEEMARVARPRREDWQRMAALHLIHRGRYGTRPTARILGLPSSTIHDWLRQGPAGIRDERLRGIAESIVSPAKLVASEEETVAQAMRHAGVPPDLEPPEPEARYLSQPQAAPSWHRQGLLAAQRRLAAARRSLLAGELTYDQESEVIRENARTPAAQEPHRFVPAQWTHPNGHPRCLVCGDEETVDGVCDGLAGEPSIFDEQRVASGPGGGQWTSDGGGSGGTTTATFETDNQVADLTSTLSDHQAQVTTLAADLKAARAAGDAEAIIKLTADVKAARDQVKADRAAIRALKQQAAAVKKGQRALKRSGAAGKRREKTLTKTKVKGGRGVKVNPSSGSRTTGVRKHSEGIGAASAAGLLVQANDTGRVLLTQRSMADDEDPAAGTWEAPGGNLEDADAGNPLTGAKREFAEEVGFAVPAGELLGDWRSQDGVYQGFVWLVASEDDVPLNLDHEDRDVLNPDDPDGDDIEVAAWWDPGDLPMPALRAELLEQWPQIAPTLNGGEAVPPQSPPTGCMVAVYLPDDVAAALAMDRDQEPTALPPDELHLTLGYLGKATEIADPGRLARVVAGFAAIAPPFEAAISGVGRFASDERTVYASVDAPMLPAWRQRLVEHLRLGGYEISMKHGFTPHVSLCTPEGPVTLDVRPLEFTVTTLTLAVAGARMDFPLEGTTALFAEPRSGSDTARPTPDVTSAQDLQDGEERAQRAAKQVAEDHAPVEGPGEPGDAGQPGTEVTGDEDLELIQQAQEPPVLDRLALEAWHRYFTLISNDVPHHRALAAVQQIDPDFTITDAQARRAFHAIGKGDVPVRFGWSAGSVKPPTHVTNVYGNFEFTDEQAQELADYLYQLALDSYAEGINAQLVQLGRPNIGAITDPDVLAELRQQTDSIAQGIVNTYNTDLAAEVYTTWIEHRGTLGRQSSERLLWEDINSWAEARADNRAEMVAVTETGRFYNQGVKDFMAQNASRGLTVVRVYVTPDECQCNGCLELVQDGPYTPEEAAGLNVPLHPRCVHLLSPQLEIMTPEEAAAEGAGTPGDWWTGQDEAAA